MFFNLIQKIVEAHTIQRNLNNFLDFLLHTIFSITNLSEV